MAVSNQELISAMQAMNKAVAIRVVQKKRGKVVPEEVVQQVVESSNVDEMIKFIDSTIVRENERKIADTDLDDSREPNLVEESKPAPTDAGVEGSSSQTAATPLSKPSAPKISMPEREGSTEPSPPDGRVEQIPEGKRGTGGPVAQKSDEGSSRAPSAEAIPVPRKDDQEQGPVSESTNSVVKDADTTAKGSQIDESENRRDDSNEVTAKTVLEKEESSDPAESHISDEEPVSGESVSKLKVRIRPTVLSAILFALLCVYVSLNLSEIEALLLQWYSTIENWVTSI